MAGKSLGIGVGVGSVASKWDVVIDSMLRVREVAAGRLSSAKVVSGCPQKVVCGSAVMAAGIPYWR